MRIGTAGWALPAADRDAFGPGQSNLARYATRFSAVEINSSFYRRHRAATWERWAAEVPADFRFSVKAPKLITHERRLVDCEAPTDEFAADIAGLGERLAVVLVQLPPSLAYDEAVADRFFSHLADRTGARIACEPRHASWFEPEADRHLAQLEIARVAADPARVPGAERPGGCSKLAYWRLHGSPVIYRSSYDQEALAATAAAMSAAPGEAWCIFDNTASSAAARNGLALAAIIG